MFLLGSGREDITSHKVGPEYHFSMEGVSREITPRDILTESLPFGNTLSPEGNNKKRREREREREILKQ